MFISKRQFFSRRNKKKMYQVYQQHWRSFITSCEVLQDKYNELERLIVKYKDTEHLHKYLSSIKNYVTSLAQYRTACMYQAGTDSDVLLTYSAYESLMFNQSKISIAIGRIDAVIVLFNMIEKDDLTVRTK